MTFQEYILRLRRRLQDLRQTDGTEITDLTKDGARWTTSELIEIANDVFDQAPLLLKSNPNSAVYQQLGEDFFVANLSSTTDSSGVYELPDNALAILPPLNAGETQYFPIPPQLYQSYLDGDISMLPTFAEHFYITLFNTTSEKRELIVIPNAAVTFNVKFLYTKTDYTTSDGSTEIHLKGINWLLLDLAERMARDREHNWDRSKIIDARIQFNLGIKNG